MSAIKLPHCAALARQLGERPAGTASRITSVLLIERSGPWSADVRERVLTEALGAAAAERMDELHVRTGLRALIIRRPGRHPAPPRPSVFVGGCRPGRRWLERLDIDGLTDLARLDLEAVAAGEGGFGEPIDGPLLLVCVHGRKDACCAMWGRPVANALAADCPELTWQCTHFGGDRWAGNLLIAPHGFMYGQLNPVSAIPVAHAARLGEVELANLRGRIGIDPFAQVAEIAVRDHTGLRGMDDVVAGPVRPLGEEAVVEVDAVGTPFRVLVRRRSMGVRGHSVCAGEAHPHRFDVVDLRQAVPV